MKETMNDNNTDKAGHAEQIEHIDQIEKYSIESQTWTALRHGGLSARAFSRLLAEFGTAEQLLSAEATDLQERFELDDENALKLAEAYKFLPQAEAFIKTLSIRGIEYLTLFDKEYPDGFRELNDPPPIIFYRGAISAPNSKSVAFVGCSEASQEGISVAVDFGARVADAGVTLVSGLTKGIDSSSLVGALTAEGKTCAIALSGFDNLYPDDCAPVFDQVINSGCVFSEYSPELEFKAEHASEANRLMSALAQAVVIGEVTSDSVGSLDVAQSCVESGKLLFILVPTEVEIHDEKALEPFVKIGAVPVKYPEDMDTILRCLV